MPYRLIKYKANSLDGNKVKERARTLWSSYICTSSKSEVEGFPFTIYDYISERYHKIGRLFNVQSLSTMRSSSWMSTDNHQAVHNPRIAIIKRTNSEIRSSYYSILLCMKITVYILWNPTTESCI